MIVLEGDGAASAPADPTRFREAIAWFAARTPVTRAEWDAMEASARRRAFTVSGLANLSMVTEVHDAITRAVAEGTTLEDFKRTMGPRLAEAWGRSNAARLETIFRTNVQTAYNAGRYEQMNRPAVKAARPFWRYSAILDTRTSETCKPLDQVIRPVDDAWWATHWPPLHFNCRSTVVSLSRSQAAEAGGVKPGPDGHTPADGFGGGPDLAGESLTPHATTPPELREAYDQRSRGTRSAGIPAPAAERDFGEPVASDRPHVHQPTDDQCGPASGEMASRHLGVEGPIRERIATHSKFKGGISPPDLAEALGDVAPVERRAWVSSNYYPGGAAPTTSDVARGLAAAVEDGGGIAIANVFVRVGGDVYPHLVVVDAVIAGFVVIRDPEGNGATRLPVTAEGFGAYVWTGDTVVAILSQS